MKSNTEFGMKEWLGHATSPLLKVFPTQVSGILAKMNLFARRMVRIPVNSWNIVEQSEKSTSGTNAVAISLRRK